MYIVLHWYVFLSITYHCVPSIVILLNGYVHYAKHCIPFEKSTLTMLIECFILLFSHLLSLKTLYNM